MTTLFFDIETVSGHRSYQELSPTLQDLRDKKSDYLQKTTTLSSADLFSEKAGIYAEFGKIVCVVIGYYVEDKFLIESFFDDDEKKLLESCFEFLSGYSSAILCGHNIKEFDIPYLCRRAIIQDIKIPPILDTQGLKPREIKHKDTLEMWKFGDYKHYTSLALLCEILSIDTPKGDIDGSEVSAVYRKQKDIHRIVEYCKRDVFATAQVYKRLQNRK